MTPSANPPISPLAPLSPQEADALRQYLDDLTTLVDQEPQKGTPQWKEWEDAVSRLAGKNQTLLSRALMVGLAQGVDGKDPAEVLRQIFAKYQPKIISRPPKSVEFPLDKINSNVWGMLAQTEKGGQLAFATEKSGSGKEATVVYSIDFSQLEDQVTITQNLTPFDKRCYVAVSALFNAGNGIISPAQIYGAMGNKGRPSAAQLKKINQSLEKMRNTKIYIDNRAEISVNTEYPHFTYDAALLPFERMSATINNVKCESSIHPFREPPLVTFAKSRGQITTVSRELLESPVSKTDQNLLIDDYLIERISHMKEGNARPKLLWETIFQKCGIHGVKQRQRAPEKILRYLEHYKACGFIQDYKEMDNGILFILKKRKHIEN